MNTGKARKNKDVKSWTKMDRIIDEQLKKLEDEDLEELVDEAVEQVKEEMDKVYEGSDDG